ncbi:MAG: methionyl-tRNA formyltransferase [Deltaproteobacteria bacterium]|nr:methionyl-tRNA formyltransferase [Deltaproteobacteria bacterium]
MRVAFFGSPAYAVPTLEALTAVDPARLQVVRVVTQPDRPKGHGLHTTPTAVRVAAEQIGLAVDAAAKIRTPEFRAALAADRLDLAIVIAYGRILPADLLALPRLGFVNLHASLLPKYRGAAPIQWAIARGETTTGVTLMRVEAGLDTGAILATRAVDIAPDEDAAALHDRLAQISARLMVESIEPLAERKLTATPQNDAAATLAPPLTKSDGRIDWTRSAADVVNHVRAFHVWPGATTTLRAAPIKIHKARIATCGGGGPVAPGTIVAAAARGEGELLVAAGDGFVSILELQAASRRIGVGEHFDAEDT